MPDQCRAAATKRSQLSAALGWKATHLLTRNLKDFPARKDIQILTPSDYVKQLT